MGKNKYHSHDDIIRSLCVSGSKYNEAGLKEKLDAPKRLASGDREAPLGKSPGICDVSVAAVTAGTLCEECSFTRPAIMKITLNRSIRNKLIIEIRDLCETHMRFSLQHMYGFSANDTCEIVNDYKKSFKKIE